MNPVPGVDFACRTLGVSNSVEMIARLTVTILNRFTARFATVWIASAFMLSRHGVLAFLARDLAVTVFNLQSAVRTDSVRGIIVIQYPFA
jgi:hypothetical protein